MKSLLIKAVDRWPKLFLPFRSRRLSKMLGRHYSLKDFTQKAGAPSVTHLSWFDLCSFDVKIGNNGSFYIVGLQGSGEVVGPTFNKCAFNDRIAEGAFSCTYKQDDAGKFELKTIKSKG